MFRAAICSTIFNATGTGQFGILPGPCPEQPRRVTSAVPDQLTPAYRESDERDSTEARPDGLRLGRVRLPGESPPRQ